MSARIVRRATRLSVLLFMSVVSTVSAQDTSLISGQNINMVSGTEWPTGDPFLQRQNEPTIGVSTRNELHLMAGSNDYRTVDLPGLPEGKTTGDSWISSYFSYDGGGRWASTLLPGYPQDMSVLGQASPLYAAGYEASADPVIRPGTHGLFYYSGIAFTRSDNAPSAGFVATYVDLNNDERGDTIKYVRTTLYDQDPGGSFIDKPWIAVDKPRNLTTTIIDVPTDSGTVSQEVQCGNLYAAWARIQGEGTAATASQIMFAKSEDCGATFSTPKQLTVPDTINQGAAIAVSPLDGTIHVAWRQFANATLSCTNKAKYWRRNPEAWPVDEIELAGIVVTKDNPNDIMLPEDDDDDDDDRHGWGNGRHKDRPTRVFRQLLAAWLNVLSGADSSAISETLEEAEDWLVENPIGSKPKKRAKKEGKRLRKLLRRYNKGRIGPGACDDLPAGGMSGMNPDAIMVTRSTDFGDNFSAPVSVASSDDFYFPFEQGTTEFSFRSTGYPTMTFDGDGRSYLAFTTRGLAIPDFDEVGGDGRIVVSTSTDGTTWTAPLPIDEPEQRGHQLMPALDFARGKVFLLYYDFREDVSQVFDRFITDLPVDATTPRHSVDVRAAQAVAADAPIFTTYDVLDNNPSTQTSRYPFLILSDAASQPVSQQTQYNPPNLPMFKGGLVPFFGDFIDLATLHFVKDDLGNWDFNTDPLRGVPVVHAVWTDNRDVVPPPDGDWTSYVPPGVGGTTSIFDPTQTVPVCTPATVADRTKMRNQNIYTSRLTQGLALAVPGNNRPLGDIQRAFVSFVQNLTDQDKSFRLELLNQPIGGNASFQQFSQAASIVEVVERNSSISRTIYVSSTDPKASVDIRVTEVDAMTGDPIGNGLTATTRINPDPSAPLPADAGILTAEEYTPAIFNPAIFNPAIFNPALLGADPNVGIYNPAIFNPAIFNNPEEAEFTQAALQQMALLNPAIFNPAIFNPAIFNPAIFNPAIFNPAIFNPAIFNPAIFNPAIFNVSTANPAIFNPAIFNPAIFNSTVDSVLETSVVVENEGNATAAYSLNLDLDQPPDGFLFQVMVYRTYVVPAVEGCELIESVQQEQLVNELSPDVNGGLLNPDATTFYIPPGDNVVVTVRVVPDPDAPVPGDPATINTLPTLELSQAVAPQAVDTVSAANGETQPQPVVIVTPTVPLLVIDAVSLADALSTSAYSQTLMTTGGDGSPVVWSLVPGSVLPAGLTLSPSGQINGAAIAQGVFNFDVRAQDDVQVTEQSFSIQVLPGGAGATFVEAIISGDSDILNDGSFVVANDLGAAPSGVAVNGVPFGTNQAGLAGFQNGGAGDFSVDAFSPELDALLSDLVFTGLLTPVTLTVGALTPGQTYRLQLLFSNDLNLTGNNIAISVQGDTYVLDDWQDDAINLRVEFVASGASVDVTFQPGPTFVPGTFPFDEPGRAILNAYALHSAPFVTVPIVDQQQPIIDQAAGGLGLFQVPVTDGAGQTLVQTVTTGITGSLNAVLLPVQCNGMDDLVVQIQGLDGSGEPNGAVLASQVVSGMSYPPFTPNPPTLRQVAFTTPASFNVGDQFAIVIDSPGQSGCDIFRGPTGDPYAGGQGFFDSRPPSALQPLVNDGGRDDLPFQTLVIPGPGPVVTGASLSTAVLAAATLEIGGAGSSYTATFNNAGVSTLTLVAMQAWIDQPGASRAAGGSLVDCGGAVGELPPGPCSGNFFIGTNNTAAAGFGTLTPGPATARIELKSNDVVIETLTLPITLTPAATTNWRADFDFASDPLNFPPFTYDCVRTVLTFSPPLPAGVSFNIEILDSENDASLGGPRQVGPFAGPSSSVGFETLPNGINYPFVGSQGHAFINFSQAMNSITGVQFRGQTPCGGPGNQQFVPGTLTPLP